jgi:DNA modification methylase
VIRIKFAGMESLSSVWSINPVNPLLHNVNLNTNKITECHLAPFPEILTFRLTHLFSEKRDTVLDPFCGSSTNFAGASQFNRKT